MRRFERKIKSHYLELDQEISYEKNNPVEWENSRWFICDFLLEVNAKGIDAKTTDLSYLYFIIRKEPTKYFR